MQLGWYNKIKKYPLEIRNTEEGKWKNEEK